VEMGCEPQQSAWGRESIVYPPSLSERIDTMQRRGGGRRRRACSALGRWPPPG
jgi:hypothetical protein